MDGGEIQTYDKAFDLNNVRALYLTNAARIYNCNKGIYGLGSKVWIRNGSELDRMLINGIEMYGSYNVPTGNYTSMLTMGDKGCGSVINFFGNGIYGNNTILNIDAVTHDQNDDNNGWFDHNWIHPPSPGNRKRH